MDVAQTKYLDTIRIVPGGHSIHVISLGEGLCDMSEDPAHESNIIGIDLDKLGDIVVFLCLNKCSWVFLIDQIACLLLDSILDDPGQFLAPYLLPINIQKILYVFNTPLQPRDLVPQGRKFALQLIVGQVLLLVENETLMEHLS